MGKSDLAADKKELPLEAKIEKIARLMVDKLSVALDYKRTGNPSLMGRYMNIELEIRELVDEEVKSAARDLQSSDEKFVRVIADEFENMDSEVRRFIGDSFESREEGPEEIRNQAIQSIKSYEDAFRQGGNIIYCCEAIEVWCRYYSMPAFSEYPIVLPDWCLGYLIGVCDRLSKLSFGNADFDESGPCYAPRISPARALSLVTVAMGFSRQGYSAFKDYESNSEKARDLGWFELLLARGMGRGAARRLIEKEKGLLHTRTLRKRMARGRLIRGQK